VNNDFFKFPSTPHLALLGDVVVRGDKVMSESERDEFIRHDLVVEEKVDGANLGISFDSSGNIRAQNRGAYLHFPTSGQWKKLDGWLAPRVSEFFGVLSDRYILFGEWCYAQHTVYYDLLPDWFLGFDLFDKMEKKFCSCVRRDNVFRKLNISQVPKLKSGILSMKELESLLTSRSHFGNGFVEGLYLRLEFGDWLDKSAKIVRPEFVQSIEQHWSRAGIQANQLQAEYRARNQ
jgi:hypothetical protein